VHAIIHQFAAPCLACAHHGYKVPRVTAFQQGQSYGEGLMSCSDMLADRKPA